MAEHSMCQPLEKIIFINNDKIQCCSRDNLKSCPEYVPLVKHNGYNIDIKKKLKSGFLPGRPLPHGESQLGSPAFEAFHRAKSFSACFSFCFSSPKLKSPSPEIKKILSCFIDEYEVSPSETKLTFF